VMAIATGGAQVELVDGCVIQHCALAAFAAGSGTQVKLTGATLEHCAQAVCCTAGAHCALEGCAVSGMSITGVEVRDDSSSVVLASCKLAAAAAPKGFWRVQGVWAHSGGTARVTQSTIKQMAVGVAVDCCGSSVALNDSWVRGNAASAVFVGYGARADIRMCSMDVLSAQSVGLQAVGQGTVVELFRSTARSNSSHGVHVSDGAHVKAYHVDTESNGAGGWLVEAGGIAELEGCRSRNEHPYHVRSGGTLSTVLCQPNNVSDGA
jgi:hypothetical protein